MSFLIPLMAGVAVYGVWALWTVIRDTFTNPPFDISKGDRR